MRVGRPSDAEPRKSYEELIAKLNEQGRKVRQLRVIVTFWLCLTALITFVAVDFPFGVAGMTLASCVSGPTFFLMRIRKRRQEYVVRWARTSISVAVSLLIVSVGLVTGLNMGSTLIGE